MNKYLVIILIYFVLLSLSFSLTTPVFEGTDESHHLQYINYICKHSSLPNQYSDRTDSAKYVPQGHQPPLFYLIGASVLCVMNSGNSVEVSSKPNPEHNRSGGKLSRVPLFIKQESGNFNSSAEQIAFYGLRFISLFFSLVTLIFIHKAASLIYKKSVYSFLPVIFAASLPQFAYISSVINNTALFVMISSISFYYFLKILREPVGVKNYVICGFFIGIGLLTSKIMLLMFPFAFAVFLYLSITEKYELGKIGRNVSIMLILSIVVGSFYFVRNFLTYGEIFASQMEYHTIGYYIAPNSIFSKFLLTRILPGLYHSFIGSFGWMNVKLPFIIYGLYTAVFIVISMGFVLFFRKDSDDKLFIYFSAVFFITNLFVIFYINLTFYVAQGRFLFPSLPAVSLLLAGAVRNLIVSRPFISYSYRPIFEVKTEKKEKIMLITLITGLFVADIVSVITNFNFYY